MKNKIFILLLTTFSSAAFAVQNNVTTVDQMRSSTNYLYIFLTIVVLSVLAYYLYQHFQKNQPTEREESKFSDSQEMERLISIRDLNEQIKKAEECLNQTNLMPEEINQIENSIVQANNEIKYLKSGTSQWKQRSEQRKEVMNQIDHIIINKERL